MSSRRGVASVVVIGACLGGWAGAAHAAPLSLCVPNGAAKPITTVNASGGCPATATLRRLADQADLTAAEARVTAAEARLTAAEAKVEDLRTLFAGVTRTPYNGKPTLRFSGMNIQIVNGRGTTATADGDGNLILGYGETPSSPLTGSHNILLGRNQAAKSWGSVIGGSHNASNGPWQVLFGNNNRAAAAAAYAGVTGGSWNWADAALSTIAGGCGNTAGLTARPDPQEECGIGAEAGTGPAMLGGRWNRASGTQAAAVAGVLNDASGAAALAAGGTSASSAGSLTSVIGGEGNDATGGRAVVVGGSSNTASGAQDAAFGGLSNTAAGDHSVVVGGQANQATSSRDVVVGGSSNVTSSLYALIVGGNRNAATGLNSAMLGGFRGQATGQHSVVAGGACNLAGPGTLISDDACNFPGSGLFMSVNGGINNQALATGATVNGGSGGLAQGVVSSVHGGFGAKASGTNSSNLGGSLTDILSNRGTYPAGP